MYKYSESFDYAQNYEKQQPHYSLGTLLYSCNSQAAMYH